MNCIDITSKWSKMLLCRKTFETTENYNSDQIGRQNEQNDELRRKTFKTTQKYESDQIIMNCVDLTSKRSKMLSYVANHSKLRKTTKVIKIQWLASIWCPNDQNNAKQRKWSNYDEFASIWRQNDLKCWVTSQNIQNNAKLQKWSKYNDLHRFDVKTIKTTQNYKSDQNTMTCIDMMSKVIKLQWIASI